MVERNAGLPPERRIEFRVGIHVGDVVEESDGDLMGDGVNIASRLEGIAEPGGICLSEDAWRQVRDKVKEAFVDLGEKSSRTSRGRCGSMRSPRARCPCLSPHPKRLARRVSPSSCCPSPISAATLSRSISSTASPRA